MKHLTFRQLRIFEAVATHLSFSKAADVLHLTQPAVSMQIKQVQEQVGLPMFRQIGKRIELTDAGHLMVLHSRKIMGQLDEAQTAMNNLKNGVDRPIRIGVITSGSYFFPQLMRAFTREHPDARFELTIQPRDELVRRLHNGQVDLALLVQPPVDPTLTAVTLANHFFVLVAPPDHPLAGAPRLRLEQLAGENFLTREAGTDTRDVANDVLGHQVPASHLMEIPSTEAIKQSIMAGMGVGLLSAHAIQTEQQTGRLCVLDVDAFPVQRAWHLVQREASLLPTPAQTFRTFLMNQGHAGWSSPLAVQFAPAAPSKPLSLPSVADGPWLKTAA